MTSTAGTEASGNASSGGAPTNTGVGGGALGGATSGIGGTSTGSLGAAGSNTAGIGGDDPGGGGGGAGARGATGGGGAAGSGGAEEGAVPLDASLLQYCGGTSPILCAIDVPDGRYDVTVELGAPDALASSSIEVETRHAIQAEIETESRVYARRTFTVDVRQERHDGGQSAPSGVLDLAIRGSLPGLVGLGIAPAPDAITVFIAGDSTACDWVATNSSVLAEDETGWAQVLSLYLERGVAVANYADSGETAGSFYTKFFPQARDSMQAGDYLFIQFGHNDQKSETDIANYRDNLLRYIDDARSRGVTPVIFTPVSRASATAANPGFAGLDDQARALATEQDVPLIDLSVLSREYYASVPDQNSLFIDGTHFHEAGAVGVADVVAEAIRESTLPLAAFIR